MRGPSFERLLNEPPPEGAPGAGCALARVCLCPPGNPRVDRAGGRRGLGLLGEGVRSPPWGAVAPFFRARFCLLTRAFAPAYAHALGEAQGSCPLLGAAPDSSGPQHQ
eukprot:15457537-Alexandrium_andersonii.AAC.1